MKSCGAGRRQSLARNPSLRTFSLPPPIDSDYGRVGRIPLLVRITAGRKPDVCKVFHSFTRHWIGVQSSPLLKSKGDRGLNGRSFLMNARSRLTLLLVVALSLTAFPVAAATTAQVARKHRVASPFIVKGPQALPSGLSTPKYGLFQCQVGLDTRGCLLRPLSDAACL